MRRHPIVRWLLLAAVLIVIGLWPPAATPIAWAFAGADHILATIPGPVLLLAAGIAWLKHRPAARPATA
ncbi:hypothetical protein [Streptomyces spiralis]